MRTCIRVFCIPLRFFSLSNNIQYSVAQDAVLFCSFQKEMVFCFQNCSDLLEEKNVLVNENTFGNSRLQD